MAALNSEHGSGAGPEDPPEGSVSSARLVGEAVEELQNIVRSLRKKLEEAEAKEKDNAEKIVMIIKALDKDKLVENETQMKNIKGYDSRNVKRPSEWSGDKEELIVWHVLFGTFMGTFDKKWKKDLEHVEDLQEQPGGQADRHGG